MSLIKVSYSLIDGAPVNILDYGADPSGVADSTSAIQAAVDAAPNNSGLYIPSGTYIITSAILINGKRLSIVGDGSQSSIIQNNGTGDALKFDGAYWQKISGLQIVGNASSGHGINFSTLSSYSQVVDCFITANGGHGIYIQPDHYGIIIDRSYLISNELDGIHAVAGSNLSTQQVNAIYISNTECKLNKGNNITLTGINFNIIDCIFESAGVSGGSDSTGHGVMVSTNNTACYGLNIKGCYFENNTRSAIKFYCFPLANITRQVYSTNIDNCYFNAGQTLVEGAHIVAVTNLADSGLVNLQIGPTNYFYSGVGDAAVDLNNAINKGDGQSRIHANIGETGVLSDSWSFFFKDIGFAPVVPYIKTKAIVGLFDSDGAITYAAINQSDNISGGSWPKASDYWIDLPAGAVIVKAGVTVYTLSSNWSITFTLKKVEKDVLSASTVATHTISGLDTGDSGVFQTTPSLATLVSANNLRINPGEFFYLTVSITDNAASANVTVGNPVISYMQ